MIELDTMTEKIINGYFYPKKLNNKEVMKVFNDFVKSGEVSLIGYLYNNGLYDKWE